MTMAIMVGNIAQIQQHLWHFIHMGWQYVRILLLYGTTALGICKPQILLWSPLLDLFEPRFFFSNYKFYFVVQSIVYMRLCNFPSHCT